MKRTHRNSTEKDEKTLLGIELPTDSNIDVREKILKDAEKGEEWKLVMSLNPEIIELTFQDPEFKNIVLGSNYKIIDGFGIVLAAQVLDLPYSERYTGVDLVNDLIEQAYIRRLTVMLIGGKGNVAERLADCYQAKYSSLDILGTEGYSDISHPTEQESEKIFSIVASLKPHLIFVAFGSPTQELWLSRNRAQLGNAVCAGVGGSFDFLMGDVKRAPKWVRQVGMEWAYRLVTQPWRWKRQVKLVSFVSRVVKERFQ